MAGRATYRQSRSSPVRSCPSIATLACSEKPSRSQHSSPGRRSGRRSRWRPRGVRGWPLSGPSAIRPSTEAALMWASRGSSGSVSSCSDISLCPGWSSPRRPVAVDWAREGRTGPFLQRRRAKGTSWPTPVLHWESSLASAKRNGHSASHCRCSLARNSSGSFPSRWVPSVK
jgi:hypothetical protein